MFRGVQANTTSSIWATTPLLTTPPCSSRTPWRKVRLSVVKDLEWCERIEVEGLVLSSTWRVRAR